MCEQKGWLPFVTAIDDKRNLTVPLTCSTTLTLQIQNYIKYEWPQDPFATRRLFVKCVDRNGQNVNIDDVNRYVVCPQGFDIVGIISILFQIGDYRYEDGKGVIPAIFDSPQQDGGKYWQYILRVKDPLGNDHFCQSVGVNEGGLPLFNKNIVLTGNINVTGIFGYSILTIPQEPLRNFKWNLDRYTTSTHREKPTSVLLGKTYTKGEDINPYDREVGGYLVLNTQESGAIQSPSNMQIIGIGCQSGCKSLVLMIGYKYDANDFLFPTAYNKYRMLEFVMSKFTKDVVIANLKLMFQQILNSNLDQYYSQDQINIIKTIVNQLISGYYPIYDTTMAFQGVMDEFFADYCQRNQTHILCGCYDSTTNIPPCYNQACQRGYMPQIAARQKCDSYLEANSINFMLQNNQAAIEKQLSTVNTNLLNTSDQVIKTLDSNFKTYEAQTKQNVNSHLDHLQTEIQTGLSNAQQSINYELNDAKTQIISQQNDINTKLINQSTEANTKLINQSAEANTKLINQTTEANNQMLSSSKQFYSQFQETLDKLQSQIIKYVDDSVIIKEISQNTQYMKGALQEDTRIVREQLKKQGNFIIIFFILTILLIGSGVFITKFIIQNQFKQIHVKSINFDGSGSKK